MMEAQGPVDDDQSHLYKVLFIGDFSVGKTSLIRRYTEGFFTPNYKLTIGVDFAVKEIGWDDGKTINLQLWDVAGHERFGTMTKVYYRYAIAAVIVFDVTRPATFEAVTKWRADVNSKVVLPDGSPIPILLLANKCDLLEEELDADKMDAFVQQHGMLGWFPVSAQDNLNVDNAMKFLITAILDVSRTVNLVQPNLPGQKKDTVSLSSLSSSYPKPPSSSTGTKKKSGGCCD